MKTAYFDCFAGISGDMIIGALLDCGLNFNDLDNELKKLNLSSYKLGYENVLKCGISGKKFNVSAEISSSSRYLSDIENIINKSELENDIKIKSIQIFRKIAESESRIHGIELDKVHFHEIGAIDSIIDIVGSMIGIKMLGITRVFSSKINVGNGFINTMHGKMPNPAPATAELLKNIPIYCSGIPYEITTPTGAAIISHLAEKYCDLPEFIISASGYGAGTRDLEIPNLLRLYIGDLTEPDYDEDKVNVIETNIDDMNPEFYEYIYARLFDSGALDVYTIPIMMKKMRPAIMLGVICNVIDTDQISDVIFSETTTSGIRISNVIRKKIFREIKSIKTAYGDVRVKFHMLKNKIITTSPEYIDCCNLAKKTGVPIKIIYDEAKNACCEKK